MRDYGKVHTSFWESVSARALTEDGRYFALYLMTCKHNNIAGAFRLPDGYACEDLQWSIERVSEGFRELFDNGFATRCEVSKWVFINNHLIWNVPDNPNQLKAVAKVAAMLPDTCSWRSEFNLVLRHLQLNVVKTGNSRSERVSEPLDNRSETPSEAHSEPFANQKQEQRQEQKQEVIGAGAPRPDAQMLNGEKAWAGAKGKSSGTRIPADWALSEEERQYAKSKGVDADQEAEKFHDHWLSKSGATGMKADWSAAWRNWVRNAIEFSRDRSPRGYTPSGGTIPMERRPGGGRARL